MLSVRAHLFWIVTKAIETNRQYTLLLLSHTTELLFEHYCLQPRYSRNAATSGSVHGVVTLLEGYVIKVDWQ